MRPQQGQRSWHGHSHRRRSRQDQNPRATSPGPVGWGTLDYVRKDEELVTAQEGPSGRPWKTTTRRPAPFAGRIPVQYPVPNWQSREADVY